MRSTKFFVLPIAVATILGSLVLATPAWAASKYKVLHRFNGKDGNGALAGVISDATGNLYGTTVSGGDNNNGVVFSLSLGTNGKWTEKVLHAFNQADGSGPYGGVVFDSAGNLYGTTTDPLGNVFKLTPDGNGKWHESVLRRFLLRGKIGYNPYAGVILDAAGNVYGTTALGGDRRRCGDGGCGTVFKLTPETKGRWPATPVFTFDKVDGSEPATNLTWDAEGNLYGTTTWAGYGSGYGGVVFKLTPGANGKWTEEVLHRFEHIGDGIFPNAVILDAAENMCGTTNYGGFYFSRECENYGCGIVFELRYSDGKWIEKMLHKFRGNDGSNPYGSPVFDAAGNLYGTTSYGGQHGYGTVFKLARKPDGKWKETVLYSFTGGTDGGVPNGALVLDAGGNLYGVAHVGGNLSCGSRQEPGCGVVFELTP